VDLLSFTIPVRLDSASRLPRRGRVDRQGDAVAGTDALVSAADELVFRHHLADDLGAEVGRDSEAAISTGAFAAVAGRSHLSGEAAVNVPAGDRRHLDGLGELAERPPSPAAAVLMDVDAGLAALLRLAIAGHLRGHGASGRNVVDVVGVVGLGTRDFRSGPASGAAVQKSGVLLNGLHAGEVLRLRLKLGEQC